MTGRNIGNTYAPSSSPRLSVFRFLCPTLISPLTYLYTNGTMKTLYWPTEKFAVKSSLMKHPIPCNLHLTARPVPAAGTPQQVRFTGLSPREVVLQVADNGLGRFTVVPQLGI